MSVTHSHASLIKNLLSPVHYHGNMLQCQTILLWLDLSQLVPRCSVWACRYYNHPQTLKPWLFEWEIRTGGKFPDGFPTLPTHPALYSVEQIFHREEKVQGCTCTLTVSLLLFHWSPLPVWYVPIHPHLHTGSCSCTDVQCTDVQCYDVQCYIVSEHSYVVCFVRSNVYQSHADRYGILLFYMPPAIQHEVLKYQHMLRWQHGSAMLQCIKT